MKRHRWVFWSGSIESPRTNPITQRCTRCGMRRRAVMVPNGSFVQQYKPQGRGWMRGQDGSTCFDHGGVPPCTGVSR